MAALRATKNVFSKVATAIPLLIATHIMETNTPLDWVLGGLAIAILISGLVMLLSGVTAMNKKE